MQISEAAPVFEQLMDVIASAHRGFDAVSQTEAPEQVGAGDRRVREFRCRESLLRKAFDEGIEQQAFAGAVWTAKHAACAYMEELLKLVDSVEQLV